MQTFIFERVEMKLKKSHTHILNNEVTISKTFSAFDLQCFQRRIYQTMTIGRIYFRSRAIFVFVFSFVVHLQPNKSYSFWQAINRDIVRQLDIDDVRQKVRISITQPHFNTMCWAWYVSFFKTFFYSFFNANILLLR